VGLLVKGKDPEWRWENPPHGGLYLDFKEIDGLSEVGCIEILWRASS